MKQGRKVKGEAERKCPFVWHVGSRPHMRRDQHPVWHLRISIYKHPHNYEIIVPLLTTWRVPTGGSTGYKTLPNTTLEDEF